MIEKETGLNPIRESDEFQRKSDRPFSLKELSLNPHSPLLPVDM